MTVPNPESADRRSVPLRLRLLSDERLARRAEKGDRRAVEAISQRYRQDLYRFCLAMTGNPGDAKAALEGTIVKAGRGLGTGERQIRLKPWLYRIARSETMDALCGPRGTGTLAPDQHRLLADLERLSQRQRAVFVMRELSGLGFAEIGAAFGISAATAEDDHRSAHKRLGRLDRLRSGVDLAALPPWPLAAGGGSGFAGTIATWSGNAVSASVVAKATATVAVVAVAGLSVQERENKDASPPSRSDDDGAWSWSAPEEHAPRPVEHESVTGVATQRSVTPPSTPSTPTAYVHQGEPPRTVGSPESEKGKGPDLRDGSLTVAALPAHPVGEHGQPSPHPHSEVDVPFEKAIYEDPEEASSEASEAESQSTPAEPEPQEESPGEQEPPAAPAPPPSSPEPPATSPTPPSTERSWGRHGGSRGRGSRRRG